MVTNSGTTIISADPTWNGYINVVEAAMPVTAGFVDNLTMPVYQERQYVPYQTRFVHNQAITHAATTGGASSYSEIIDRERTFAINHLQKSIDVNTSAGPISLYGGGYKHWLYSNADIAITGNTATTSSAVYETIQTDASGNVRIIYSVDQTTLKKYQEQVSRQIVKELMKKNLTILVKKSYSRSPMITKAEANELKARETLRDMITETEWRRYLTNGFIMVKGLSGKWYQIFNKYSERVQVYENNKPIARICIHSDKTCPPTDHVINLKILAEIDEECLWSGGNIYPIDSQHHEAFPNRNKNKPQPVRTLVEAYKEMKSSA